MTNGAHKARRKPHPGGNREEGKTFMASIPDTTRRIRAYQERACEISSRLRSLDEEINAHFLKGQLDRAAVLIQRRDELVKQRNSAYASVKQLKHAELMTPGLLRRRKSDQVLR